MRTAAAVLLAALALLGLSLSAASGTAAAECSWQRHSKRVIKHVRRHGRLHKVARRRVWWTCRPIAAPAPEPVSAPVPPTTPPPVTTTPTEPEPEANRVAVKSVEYYYVLSRPTVHAGEVTVELNNQGQDPHNLNIRREGDEGEPLQITETGSLQHSVAKFDLPPGTYRLWCSLPEHEEKGMQTTLVVE
jgi:plastocyanin